MKIANKMMKFIAVLLVFIPAFLFTAVTPAYAATSPGLGDAASFAVLAGTAITNVPTSVITGDVGLSPAAGSNYSGLTNLEVSGTIFAVDTSGPAGSAGSDATLLTSAKTGLTNAYTALNAGANADGNCIGGVLADNTDLSTMSPLVAGLYCSAGSFRVTTTLALSGSGVWVFKTVSGLTTSVGSVISGGDPCNVWWRVGSSATINGSSTFVGNILALTSINMGTGATINGRALAQNGAVTLQSNTINQSCTASRTRASTTPPGSGGPASAPAAKVCPNLNCVTPLIIESRRVDANSIFISWGPYAGINTFNIRYGLENGKWLYSTGVTGFSTTIHALPPNQPIWVLIEPTDNCSIGPCGVAMLVGGPALPNTGFAPHQNNFPWYFPIGIGVAISGLLVLIQRKHI